MKNSQWVLHECVSVFVLMLILFSSPWLMAKDELTIIAAFVDLGAGEITLRGDFEIKPGKSGKGGGGDEIVVTLDGVPLNIVSRDFSQDPNEIVVDLPPNLEGTHRLAVCKEKDKECPKLEKHQEGNQIDVTIGFATGGGGAGEQGEQGEQGIQGVVGLPGTNGTNGTNGINCWDLNGNGVGDFPVEDVNADNQVDVNDCTGPQGPTGETGAPGSGAANPCSGDESLLLMAAVSTTKP